MKFDVCKILTMKQIASLVNYGAKHGEPVVSTGEDSLTAVMKFDVIGLPITIEQHFNTSPCIFVVGTGTWKVAFNAERNANAPARPQYGSGIMSHIFGEDSEGVIYMFGASWTVSRGAILAAGTEDAMKHDVALLRMVDDLWD